MLQFKFDPDSKYFVGASSIIWSALFGPVFDSQKKRPMITENLCVMYIRNSQVKSGHFCLK